MRPASFCAASGDPERPARRATPEAVRIRAALCALWHPVQVETVLASAGAVWMLLVPGMPAVLLLSRAAWSWWEILALSPLLSVGLNFGLLQALNRLGLTPDMRLYGLVLTAATGLGVWRLLRGRPGLRKPPLELLAVALPCVLGFLLWRAAFAGRALVAANQDAINHNFWIARVMSEGSALGAAVRVDSPLQEQVAGVGFYPLAWHTQTATAGALFGVPAPTMSLVSTFLFWSVVLTLGLVVLARRISSSGVLLGVSAAVLAQTLPLLPGVPMTWGAMTTVIGVALLPAALFSVIIFFEEPGWRTAVLLGASGLTLFVAHSPEAATLAVIAAVAAAVQAARGRLARTTTMLLSSLTAAVLLGALLLRGAVADLWVVLSAQLGGNERSINESLGSFLTLSINVPTVQLCFGFLALAGLCLVSMMTRGGWLLIALGSCLGVYLVAGANAEPLVSLRPLTAPWYGSYERTAWVAVPFLALIAALPVVALLERSRGHGWRSTGPAALAALLTVVQCLLGGQASVSQLREGLAENQVAGPGSRELFEQARALADEGEVILTQAGDGSIYASMYEDVPVTNGAYTRSGEMSPQLAELLVSLPQLCS